MCCIHTEAHLCDQYVVSVTVLDTVAFFAVWNCIGDAVFVIVSVFGKVTVSLLYQALCYV